MSRLEKLKKRLERRPSDFSFEELRRLLCAVGYREISAGKTAGSRVAFQNPATGHLIRLHRPHPGSILKKYQVDQIIDLLREKGFLP
jgi:hypothetical protein